MGLFKWINKGVRVDKGDIAVADVEPVLQMQGLNMQSEFSSAQEQNAPTFASSALFDRNFDIASGSHLSSNNQFSQTLSGPTLGNRNILVVAPKSEKDVQHIVENLSHGEACIVNFEGMPVADAQRRLDFLSGVVCAIGGSIKQLDPNKYILTPNTMGIKM